MCAAWLLPAGVHPLGSRALARNGQNTPDAPVAITHGPYLQLPANTSMTIVWHTNRPCVSRVEYWAGDKGRASSAPTEGGQTVGAELAPPQTPPATAVSTAHGLIDNDRTSHIIRLNGLKPGTRYRYRVVSREFQGYEKQHIVKYGGTVSSDVFSFTTLDQKRTSYSFAVMSDIHENAKRLDAMLAALDWNRVPFVVFNGDMVNDFMNADQPFSGFLDVSVARFARTIPFVYVRGNHDVRGRFARRLADYLPTYSGGASSALAPPRDGRAYYSFDEGPVHFVVLDSGEDKIDTHEYYNGLVAFEPYRREQARWLADDLRGAAARRARYRIVLSHIPPYDGTSRTGTPEEGFAIQQVRECWEKPANAGGVDLWLSGHTHRYAHIAPTAGRNRYHLVIGAPDTVTRVDVSTAQLRVTVTRETGELVDTVAIRPRR
jgi:predicted phosphodiesterase